MPLVDSPDLEDYSEGIKTQAKEPKSRTGSVRLFIGILAVVLIILGILNYTQSHHLALVTGRGTLTGLVLNEKGDGVPAEITVFGTNIKGRADENGMFTISNVPKGNPTLTIGYEGQAVQHSFALSAGEILDIGTIRLVTTALPQ